MHLISLSKWERVQYDRIDCSFTWPSFRLTTNLVRLCLVRLLAYLLTLVVSSWAHCWTQIQRRAHSDKSLYSLHYLVFYWCDDLHVDTINNFDHKRSISVFIIDSCLPCIIMLDQSLMELLISIMCVSIMCTKNDLLFSYHCYYIFIIFFFFIYFQIRRTSNIHSYLARSIVEKDGKPSAKTNELNLITTLLCYLIWSPRAWLWAHLQILLTSLALNHGNLKSDNHSLTTMTQSFTPFVVSNHNHHNLDLYITILSIPLTNLIAIDIWLNHHVMCFVAHLPHLQV